MIYFATDGYSIKIGRSRDVAARLKSLATGSARPLQLIATVYGDSQHETKVHNDLASHRLNGEWFKDCQTVRDAIAEYQVSGIAIAPTEDHQIDDEAAVVSECRAAGQKLVRLCERAGSSRMEAYEIVAAKVGTNATWLRKFLAGYSDAKEPRLSVGYALLSDAVLQSVGSLNTALVEASEVNQNEHAR